MPTTMPNDCPVSASNTVPVSQFSQATTPPAMAVSNPATAPTMSHRRQPGGGCSWAQPNQAEAKKPSMAALRRHHGRTQLSWDSDQRMISPSAAKRSMCA